MQTLSWPVYSLHTRLFYLVLNQEISFKLGTSDLNFCVKWLFYLLTWAYWSCKAKIILKSVIKRRSCRKQVLVIFPIHLSLKMIQWPGRKLGVLLQFRAHWQNSRDSYFPGSVIWLHILNSTISSFGETIPIQIISNLIWISLLIQVWFR